jgi:DNA polymerase IV
MKKILHLDLDAFFASVEQLDFPELRGKPVIVGGLKNRGVVSTCSYEARKYGIHSAMPTAKARKLCPKGIFLPVRYERYREKSREVRNIYTEYSDRFETVGLDEAYLDSPITTMLYPSHVKSSGGSGRKPGLHAASGFPTTNPWPKLPVI